MQEKQNFVHIKVTLSRSSALKGFKSEGSLRGQRVQAFQAFATSYPCRTWGGSVVHKPVL